MQTELLEKSPDIVGGHKVDVVQNNIRNPRLHRVLEQMTRLCIYLLECDSNNTSSKAKPSDVRYVRAQWGIVKDEFAFSTAEENNDLPAGAYEQAYKVFTIHQKEVQRVVNVKVRAVLEEIWDTMELMLSVDSAATQGFTASEDIEAISKRLAFVDRVMDRWIGDGKDLMSTGIIAPAYEILGTIVPSINSDWAEKLEPSKRYPASRLADTPDVELK